jgi:predicted small lipoprotein YifL
MRAFFSVVLLVFMLQGCGLKGPLFLPKPIEQQNGTAQNNSAQQKKGPQPQQDQTQQDQPQQDQPQSQ